MLHSTIPRSPASSSSKRTSSSKSTASLSSIPFTEDDPHHSTKIPCHDASIEERMEYVLSCAKQADFDGLDSLITTYYTETFSQSSSVSAEQRISRRRQLPHLVAELRKQSGNWSQWERNGFEDEILRTAEAICAAENSRFIAGEKSSSPVGESTLDGSSPSVTPKTFQDEASLPFNSSLNDWASLNSILFSRCLIYGHYSPLWCRAIWRSCTVTDQILCSRA